jgi:hypothetical protein
MDQRPDLFPLELVRGERALGVDHDCGELLGQVWVRIDSMDSPLGSP